MKKYYPSGETGFNHILSGLRGTLLAAFGILSLGAVVLTAAISIFLGTRISQDLATNELVAEVALNEQAINNWLNERRRDLTVIVNNPIELQRARHILSDKYDAVEYENFLKRLEIEIGATGRFQELFLVDSQGQVILTTTDSELQTNVSDQEYFQAALIAPFTSKPSFSSDIDGYEVTITVPVRDEFSGVIGFLAAQLDFAEVSDVIIQANSTQTGQLYLVSSDRRFLSELSLPATSVEANSIGIDRALTPGPDRNGSEIYDNYNGLRVVGAYRWIPDLEVVLLSERSEEEALAQVRQLTLVISIVAVIIVIIATGLALYITALIVRPIAALTQASVAIAEGDLEQKVAVRSSNEIGQLANAFNSMTTRLRNLIARLSDRTRALETSAVISRQLIDILDLDELLEQVVTQIQKTFGYYHVHIYLIDTETGELVMREGTGEVGQKLKLDNHRLQVGQGIVGRVANEGQAFLATDVDEISYFVRNPLLSETKSELAVPLRKSDKILGVLDMQSTEVDNFDQEDKLLMQSIADQLAIAIDNARLFEETQTALANVEKLNRRLTHQSWQDIDSKLRSNNFSFTKPGLGSTPTHDMPTMLQAVKGKRLTQQVIEGNGNSVSSVALPLTVRGEIIGVLGIERSKEQPWSEDEIVTIQSITEQVALALDSARLARETERAAWRDQIVSESTAKVWSSSEMEEVMKAAVAQLGDKLKASEVVIRLTTENELEY